jgi:hypothetical protein
LLGLDGNRRGECGGNNGGNDAHRTAEFCPVGGIRGSPKEGPVVTIL